MKYDPSELATLAKRLESAANVALAKAKQLTLHNELADAEIQNTRANEAKHFSEVCEHFAGLLKTKAKRAKFDPPTLTQVFAFVARDETCKGWPDDDVHAWYNHFQSNGWKVSGVATMVDWKAAAQNGARRWRKEHLKASNAKVDKPDPAGWKQWVVDQGFKPTAFQYAPDWMKTEFRQRK